jgi:hypothetical protein
MVLHLGIAQFLPALLQNSVTEGREEVGVLVLAHVLRDGWMEGGREGGVSEYFVKIRSQKEERRSAFLYLPTS